MSHFLIRQAAKAIAGSAAPQVASQLAQRLSAPATRDEDRRRFLIWLAGPFKQAQPEHYQRIWTRLRGDDEAVDAFTGVFLELQTAEPSALTHWFTQLAQSDDQHIEELLSALRPTQPDPKALLQQAQHEAGTTVRGAARLLGRAYRQTVNDARHARKRKR